MIDYSQGWRPVILAARLCQSISWACPLGFRVDSGTWKMLDEKLTGWFERFE